MAQAHPARTVMTVRQSQAHTAAHLKLLELLHVHNNMLGVSQLGLPVLAAITEPRDPFNVAIVGSSVVSRMVSSAIQRGQQETQCNWRRFEQSLGSTFSLASASFIVLPRFASILEAIDIMFPECSSSFDARYTPSMAQAEWSREELLVARSLSAVGATTMTVRRVGSSGAFAETTLPVLLRVEETPSGALNRHPIDGVSLHTMLHLGIVPALKAQLLRMFLEMPVWQMPLPQRTLPPWLVRFIGAGLGSLGLFEHPGSSGLKVVSAVGASTKRLDDEHRAAIWDTLQAELDRCPAEHQNGVFSFAEYGSGAGRLSMAVAARYPNATVLSIGDDSDMVAGKVFQKQPLRRRT